MFLAEEAKTGQDAILQPFVCLIGNINIHDYAYVGPGTTLRQGTPEYPLTIGTSGVSGMNATVTKDLALDVAVIGNPPPVAKGLKCSILHSPFGQALQRKR